MSYLDKTFCASPRCNNDCGRRMTDAQREQLSYSEAQYVSYGYFCGEDEAPRMELPFYSKDVPGKMEMDERTKEFAKRFIDENVDLLKRLADR